jgi:arylsulfatase
MIRKQTRSLVALGIFVLALGCSSEGPSAPQKHAILITVDTLRADRIGAYGYPSAATPQIDALAADSIRFDAAFAHSSMTAPSIASLITGRLPRSHGVVDNQRNLPEGLPTLASILQRAGFATGAFIGNYTLRRSKGFQRGFSTVTRGFRAREIVRQHPENLAASLTDRAIAWLDSRDAEQRIFLWVHYQEPHGPYTPPDFRAPETPGSSLPRNDTNSGRGGIPKYQWLGHGHSAEYLARYDGEVAEVDRQLGRLLSHLESTGILDESVLVFTADHGEAFGEDDLWFAHGEGLGEVLLRVPLLLRIPGLAPEVRQDVVRLVDVLPTLVESLGGVAPDSDGRSLLDRSGERAVVAQVVDWRSYRVGELELLQQGESAPQLVRAGDLDDQAQGRALGELSAKLAEMSSIPEAPPDSLSAEERNALRALGYVD